MKPDEATLPSVLLIGEGGTTLTALRSLRASCNVRCIVRNVADPASDAVHLLAKEAELPVKAVTLIAEIEKLVRELKPDAVVVSSFNRILPAGLLQLTKFVNVHYSPLPRYRGRANVNWAIINGEPTAAISIHVLEPGLDSGNILFQEVISITSTDTVASLYERLNTIQERELGTAVCRYLGGDVGTPQDHRKASYGCARTPDDGEIDWLAPIDAIERLIRALAPPFPGAYTYFGTRKLTIRGASVVREGTYYEGRVPGRVVLRSKKEGWVDVLTADGTLRIQEFADEAGTVLLAAEVLRSTRDTLGLTKSSLLASIRQLEARLAAVEQAMNR